jgi:hypothetical protein
VKIPPFFFVGVRPEGIGVIAAFCNIFRLFVREDVSGGGWIITESSGLAGYAGRREASDEIM